jgi:hypothetical protein
MIPHRKFSGISIELEVNGSVDAHLLHSLLSTYVFLFLLILYLVRAYDVCEGAWPKVQYYFLQQLHEALLRISFSIDPNATIAESYHNVLLLKISHDLGHHPFL